MKLRESWADLKGNFRNSTTSSVSAKKERRKKNATKGNLKKTLVLQPPTHKLEKERTKRESLCVGESTESRFLGRKKTL